MVCVKQSYREDHESISMQLGYNTNGFAFHSLQSALEIIAETGYQSVALTLDVHHLNPFSSHLERELEQVRKLLASLKLNCVIETGARFLLDPRQKHQPTLLSSDATQRQKRIEFYHRCIDIAHELNAGAISLWSGNALENNSCDQLRSLLCNGLEKVCRYAESTKTKIAFEPEPGMFIDTMQSWQKLLQQFDHPLFGLTLDIGHLQCLEKEPIPTIIQRWSDRIWNIHIEDMRAGKHDHLRFGEGEIDFPPVMQTLKQINYSHGVHVELSRHAHMAPSVARESFRFLQEYLEAT